MKTDNLHDLKNHLTFENEGDFYYLQIIQRRKENPELNKSEKIIKIYYVENLEYLYKKWGQITGLCHYFNARAYLWINKRNYNTVAHKTNILLAKYMDSGQHRSVLSILDKAIGRYHSAEQKKWIIDIDTKEGEVVGEVSSIVENCMPNNKKKIIDVLDTKNGFHLISLPFNTKEFDEKINESIPVEIHKDNPTVLYSL